MKFPMPREYKYIRPIDDVWYGKSTYKEGLIVPQINIKYGSVYSKVMTMPSYVKYLIGSLRELTKTVKFIRNNPYTGNKSITPEFLEELEDYSKSLGISVIEYTHVINKLNEVFFHYIKTKTPYVVMKYAMTLDGKIATYSGKSKWITGEKAREHVHHSRHMYSAIMVGVDTVITDNPMLDCRMPNGKNPKRIIYHVIV